MARGFVLGFLRAPERSSSVHAVRGKKYDNHHFFQGKNAPWGSVCGMKRIKKSSTKLTQSSKSKTTIKEDTGKLLLEAAKLVFGSLCLGGILRGELPHVMLIIVGFAVAFVLGIIGLNLVKKKKDGDDPPTSSAHDSAVKKE